MDYVLGTMESGDTVLLPKASILYVGPAAPGEQVIKSVAYLHMSRLTAQPTQVAIGLRETVREMAVRWEDEVSQ